jgi:diaminopimelate decarboxylase
MKKINFLKIVKKYGTPLYIYDTEKILFQYKAMKKAFFSIKNLKINYACKANTNINILKFFKKIGSGLDTVSIQEVKIGLKAGFNPKNIIYTPNGVSFSEFKKATKLGIHINIDNLSILEKFGNEIPNYPVGIRINPHIMAGGNYKISVGHINSKFGISYHQLFNIKKICKKTGLKIEGIHMHTGSDIKDINIFLKEAEILFKIAKEFPFLKYIDFGSGFKVSYKKDDISTDINLLGILLTKKFNFFCKKYGKDINLIFEPGKFLISEAGYFLVSVNVIKHTTSTIFVSIDSGFNHFIRPMFYKAYHHIENLSNPLGNFNFYTVVGYICELDTFCVNRKIQEIHVGDILCFKNAGAYCFSMSSNYNSRYRPSEIMILKGKDFLIRKRENFQDLIRNMIIVDF